LIPTSSATLPEGQVAKGSPLDFLTQILCLCIGTMVAWLIALDSERGAASIVWNHVFGIAGAALCALTIGWFAPDWRIVGLVVAGPPSAILLIVVGNALRRAL
jgi:hypothetical protein